MSQEQKRCWLVRVTWDKGVVGGFNKVVVRPGSNIEDTPEAICNYVKALHHRRGSKYFYPLTAEIDYEVDPDDLPTNIQETNRKPEPLSAPPRPLSREQKEYNKEKK